MHNWLRINRQVTSFFSKWSLVKNPFHIVFFYINLFKLLKFKATRVISIAYVTDSFVKRKAASSHSALRKQIVEFRVFHLGKSITHKHYKFKIRRSQRGVSILENAGYSTFTQQSLIMLLRTRLKIQYPQKSWFKIIIQKNWNRCN